MRNAATNILVHVSQCICASISVECIPSSFPPSFPFLLPYFHVDTQLFQLHLLKRPFSFPLWQCHFWHKSMSIWVWVCFWALLLNWSICLSIFLFVFLVAISYCPNNVSHWLYDKSHVKCRKPLLFLFFLFLQEWLGILNPSHFHINILELTCQVLQKKLWIF